MSVIAGSPRRFGRLVEHDERSRAYGLAISPRTAPHSVLWESTAPVWDQGELGACTGHALVAVINTVRSNTGRTDYLTAADAEAIYSAATEVDDFEGSWPPADTGSSGLAACKAGVARGLLSGYRHAFGLNQLLIALHGGPVSVGTVWFDGMNEPDAQGFLHAQGEELGGHQYAVVGSNIEHGYLTIQNSWGSGWGERGRARITFTDFAALLDAEGDVTVPFLTKE
ncbi:cysteine protease [Gordonia phage ObLaDi]|uniref:Cysteine protease n=3 Tax=Cafassovirus TaxID=3425056 RepID=A0A9E7TYC1_9CAUD|nr:cysteine protease [Gordonia phage Cafasso]UVK59769.1 cysteine protease [Gordonia phage Aleemily]UXE03753.1 cysteine protease [Gordonia phage ObLaDi]